MDKEIFDGIMCGVEQAIAYVNGDSSKVTIHHVAKKQAVDIKPIRKKLGMTQRKFAETFGFAIDSIRNWENNRRTPDAAAQTLLKVIAHNPNSVIEALKA